MTVPACPCTELGATSKLLASDRETWRLAVPGCTCRPCCWQPVCGKKNAHEQSSDNTLPHRGAHKMQCCTFPQVRCAERHCLDWEGTKSGKQLPGNNCCNSFRPKCHADQFQIPLCENPTNTTGKLRMRVFCLNYLFGSQTFLNLALFLSQLIELLSFFYQNLFHVSFYTSAATITCNGRRRLKGINQPGRKQMMQKYFQKPPNDTRSLTTYVHSSLCCLDGQTRPASPTLETFHP